MKSHHHEKWALTTQSEHANDEPECLFFKLPPELRKFIYDEALIHKAVLEIYPSGDPVEYMDEWEESDRPWARFRPSEPSLLRTCKQIREEALPIFYAGNVFKATSYDESLHRFIKWLTPEKRLMVRNLHLMCMCWVIYVNDREVSEVVGCVALAQQDLVNMNEWLELNGIILRKNAIQVFVRNRDDVAGDWTHAPGGKCELGDCCGNRRKAMQLEL